MTDFECFDQELEAVVVFDFGVAGGDDGEKWVLGEERSLVVVGCWALARACGVGVGKEELDEMAEGGIVEGAPLFDFGCVKAG